MRRTLALAAVLIAIPSAVQADSNKAPQLRPYDESYVLKHPDTTPPKIYYRIVPRRGHSFTNEDLGVQNDIIASCMRGAMENTRNPDSYRGKARTRATTVRVRSTSACIRNALAYPGREMSLRTARLMLEVAER